MRVEQILSGRNFWKPAALLAWIGFLPQAPAAPRLEFEFGQYAVPANPAGTIEFRIMIDGNDTVPGRQPVPHGLFSYGFVMGFDPAVLQRIAEGSVTVEPALDFSGFAPGARVVQEQGQVTVSGNIQPGADLWQNSGLATLRFRTLSHEIGSTPLTLRISAQSPQETVFVDGRGMSVDALITPVPATLNLLQPVQVEWIRQDAPHARIRYGVHPSTNVTLQWSRSLESGEWQPFPGAPHNSGEYLDFAVSDRRFYRLVLTGR